LSDPGRPRPGSDQGLWRIEYLNTGRVNSPKMWAVQFATSGSTSGSNGSKLTLNNNKNK